MDEMPVFKGSSSKAAIIKTVIISLSALIILLSFSITIRKLIKSRMLIEEAYMSAFMNYNDRSGENSKNALSSESVNDNSNDPEVPEETSAEIINSDERKVKGIISKTFSKIVPGVSSTFGLSYNLKSYPLIIVTESSPYDSFYKESADLYSEKGNNLERIGKEFARTLSQKGLNCLHLPYEDAIKKNALLMIDIRRDVIFSEDSRLVRAFTYSDDGQKSAQILIEACGFNDSLSFSLELSEMMGEVSRGVIINEEKPLSALSISLYTGTAANAFDEALAAAEYSANIISDLIFEKSK